MSMALHWTFEPDCGLVPPPGREAGRVGDIMTPEKNCFCLTAGNASLASAAPGKASRATTRGASKYEACL